MSQNIDSINITNSIYYTNLDCVLSGIAPPFNSYLALSKYVKNIKITKKQLYSLYVNKDRVKIQTIINNLEIPYIQYKNILVPPIRESILCIHGYLTNIRSVLNEYNYKYFIYPSPDIIKKYPLCYYQNGINNYELTPTNQNILKKFIYKRNFKIMTNKFINSYLVKNSYNITKKILPGGKKFII